MRIEYKIILASILIGLLIWISDALVGVFIFHEGEFPSIFYQDLMAGGIYLKFIPLAIVMAFGLMVALLAPKMKRHENLFKILFDNTCGGVAIFRATGDGEDFILKDINGAAETIEGVDREDVIGKDVEDAISNAVELELRNVFKRVWSSGEPERLPPRFWLRGARVHYVYKLPTGEVVAVYDDADERKLMEEEISRRTDELGKIMQEMNCLYGISKLAEEPGITVNEIIQGTVELVPMAWQYPTIACARVVTGSQDYRTSNFKETPWRQRADIIMEGIPAGFVEVGYLESRPERDEGPFLSGERALIHMLAEQLARTLALKQAQDAVAQQVVELGRVNRDLKNTQTELIQMGKLTVMGKMAAEMAHEINNPLGAIRVHIDGLRRDLDKGQLDPADAMKVLRTVGKSIEKIAEAVSRMRYFSKRSDDRYEALDLNVIVSDSLDMLRAQLEKEGIELSETYSQTPLSFYGNTNMLEQLFSNLVLNARDAINSRSRGGGKIVVETRDGKNGAVSAVIADDGKGMDEETKEQIFSPFFTTKEEGVGLGMAIVRRILDSHKGDVEVESAPESGTTFTLTFPRDRRVQVRDKE